MVGRRTVTGEAPAESADRAPSRLAAVLTGERDRWILWLPVMVGLGIGVYFGLPAEPPLWLGAVSVAAAAAAGWGMRRRPAILIVLLGMGGVAAGFAVAQWRTVLVAAPVITQRIGPATVSGRISAVQIMPKARRVTLERLSISRLGDESTPAAVRIRLAGRQPVLAPGDWIRVRAILAPPPPPATPGAFDFQRQSYFRRLGGVGFSVGTAEVTARTTDAGWDAVRLSLARTRQAITERVLGAVDGAPGGRGGGADDRRAGIDPPPGDRRHARFGPCPPVGHIGPAPRAGGRVPVSRSARPVGAADAAGAPLSDQEMGRRRGHRGSPRLRPGGRRHGAHPTGLPDDRSGAGGGAGGPAGPVHAHGCLGGAGHLVADAGKPARRQFPVVVRRRDGAHRGLRIFARAALRPARPRCPRGAAGRCFIWAAWR